MPCTANMFPSFLALLALTLLIPQTFAAYQLSLCSSQNTGSDNDAQFWTWQSNGWCHDQCIDNYAFAIVLENDCWCSNYAPADTTDTSDCSDTCPGYPDEFCGNKAKGLYGYVALNNKPSGTQGGSQPTSAKPSSSNPTTLQTSASSQDPPTTEAPPAYTEVKTLTVSGVIVTQTVINSPTNAPALTETRKGGTNVGAIVGGVVGGLAVLGAIIGGVLFFLYRRRRQQNSEEDGDGQSGVHRNVSTMSKAGLLRTEKAPQHPPPITTSFNRRTSRHIDAESVSPISGSDRRNSRPYIFDQRLNPSAIMAMDNGSRGSFGSLDDSRDYGRELNVRNPDPPRESIDDRKP